EVGAVKSGVHVRLGFDGEGAADVLGDLGRGGGGEPEHAADGELAGEAGELEVVGAKVVSPFGDAVRLVDDEQVDLERLETGEKTFVGETLGRDVEEFERAGAQRVLDGGEGLARHAG